MKEKRNNTIRVGKFNILLLSIYKSSREKVNKETLVMKYILEPNGLNTHIQSVPSNSSKIHILLSAHGASSRIGIC
jgi:hypothetical protein